MISFIVCNTERKENFFEHHFISMQHNCIVVSWCEKAHTHVSLIHKFAPIMIYYLSNIHFSSTGPVAVSLCLSGVPAVLASVDCSLDESPPATTTGPPYPSNETAVPERREQG